LADRRRPAADDQGAAGAPVPARAERRLELSSASSWSGGTVARGWPQTPARFRDLAILHGL